MLPGRIAILSVFSCLVAVTTWADGTNLIIDGITYSNVTFRTVTPATVTIFHSTGIATIPLEKLPTSLQAHFGYDEQKAQEYRQKMAERDRQNAIIASQRREYQREIDEIKVRSLDASGVVQQIVADGILASQATAKVSRTGGGHCLLRCPGPNLRHRGTNSGKWRADFHHWSRRKWVRRW